MIHTEHFLKADESYEIRHNNKGNVIHVLHSNGQAVVYPTITALIEHKIQGKESERFYCGEKELDLIYDILEYDYYKLKAAWEDYKSNDDTRKCHTCGEVMKEGYCINDGMEYYCTDKCLHTKYSKKEWNKLYDGGNGSSYWTTWED